MFSPSLLRYTRGLVPIKRAVDYAVKIRVNSSQTAVETSNVKMSMNPFCEVALEEATLMKEQGHLTEVVAVSIGSDKCQETLRQALALGADRAIHIKTDLRTDQEVLPLQVAKMLKKIVEKENPRVVLMGKQSIDGDNNQTGQMLAGLMNWPQATFASKVEVSGDKRSLTVNRDVDEGIETVSLPLPAVVTVGLRLNKPRFASLPSLMKAKKKQIEVIQADSMGTELIFPVSSRFCLGISLDPVVKTVKVEDPPRRLGGKKVASVDELIDKLRNEAKVI